MGRVALYRKYRPQTFDELYGQDHVAKTLKNSIVSGNFAHAYLFCGPRGTGKTSAARLLAKAINCLSNKDGNPDNTCDACKNINEEKALDIIEIDAASHTQVDNIREIIVERANFAPTNLRYKVYIIDEAHMLSKSSFNALLKTLEEPPEHVVFILATTEASKIIPTIVSRCQRFDFKRINLDDMIKRLDYIAKSENIELEAGVSRMIAVASEGGFRDAISLLDQISSIKTGKISKIDLAEILGITDNSMIDDYVISLLEKEQEKALAIVEKVIEGGYDPVIFLKNSLDHLRKLLILKVSGSGESDLTAESLARDVEVINKTSVRDLIFTIDTLIKSETLYRTSSIPSLALEISAIKLCSDEIERAEIGSQPTGAKAETKKEIKQEIVSPVATKDEKPKTTKNEKVKWQELLLELKGKNNSIHAFLKVCDPEFTGDTALLHFPYKFHKERIEDTKNRRVVEEALTKVYGVSYKVKCSLKPVTNVALPEKPRKDDLLEEALEILGGEVIE